MRRIILPLILLAIGAGAIALLVMRDPGQATLSWGDWRIETSLAALLGIIIGAVLLIGLILRLLGLILRAPRLLRQRQARRQQERALHDVADGMLCLVEGDWTQAERICKRHNNDDQGGLIWLLGAALAAHRKEEYARRDDLLRQAEARFPKASLALHLVKAEMLLDEGALDDAAHILQTLHAEVPRHVHVLRLLTEVQRRRGDWDGVLQRMPELSKLRAMHEERLLELEEEAIAGRLAQLVDQGSDAIIAFWRGVRRQLRGHERLLAAYARALAASGAHDVAVDMLLKTLGELPSMALSTVLAELDSSQPQAALEAVEGIIAHHPNAALHLFAARMAWKLDLWGKARAHAEQSIAIKPSIEAHTLLAQVLEREGQTAKALEQTQQALALVMNDKAARQAVE